MWSPVRRSCAERSARARDLRTRLSIFTASIPLCMRKRPIFCTSWLTGNFDDFRNNTSSIIIGSRLAELLQAGVGDTVQLLSPNGEYWRFTVAAIARAASARSIPPGFIRTPGSRRPCCNNPPARR